MNRIDLITQIARNGGTSHVAMAGMFFVISQESSVWRQKHPERQFPKNPARQGEP
jgi:hypothetical protein